ncbi:MAG: GAF domain-containing sensor histidine kinase [Armatimonadota bacterium]
MVTKQKTNCWEVRQCGRGPTSVEPCPTALDLTSTGVNGGVNAGRICWTVPGTSCDGKPHGDFVDKQDICLNCAFFHRVREEEAASFRFVKLAQGVWDAESLHARITQIESLMGIHDRLRAMFNLDAVIREITRQARAVTQAQRSLVLFLRGDPPRLYGEFMLRGREVKVDIACDETSAVGSAAARNTAVNVKEAYRASSGHDDVPFNRAFDEACHCRTDSLLAVPIRDSDGRVLGVITAANSAGGAFSHDDQWFMERFAVEVALALEKARLLQEAVAAGRMASISESVAGLSHFLKDVAHALLGTSYVIRRAIDQGRVDDVKSAWEIFDRHVQRLVDLCKDVLTYDPDRPDEICPGDLNETVADAVGLLRGEARARAIELDTALGEGLGECRHSKRGVYRCVVNLVVNAFDACLPSGGHVTVATKRNSTHALVQVCDDGRGMDAATRALMLGTFKTGDRMHRSGIGLPTVVDILERHGGRLEIESSPGSGSTFTILLPLGGRS